MPLTSQPQHFIPLSKSNALAKRFDYFTNFSGPSTLKDASESGGVLLTATPTNITYTCGRYGKGATSSGSGYINSNSVRAGNYTTSFFLAFQFSVPAITNRCIIYKGPYASGSYYIVLEGNYLRCYNSYPTITEFDIQMPLSVWCTPGQVYTLVMNAVPSGGASEWWIDGNLVGSSGSIGTLVASTETLQFLAYQTSPDLGGTIYWFGCGKGSLSAKEISQLQGNPYQVLNSTDGYFRKAKPATITVTRPNSDITVSGWSSTEGTYFGAINEEPYNDTTYITSPNIDGSTTYTIIMGLNTSLATGSYDVTLRAKCSSGQKLRVYLLDSSSSVLGTSFWQNATGTYTQYTIPVTMTGTATRIKLEVANI